MTPSDSRSEPTYLLGHTESELRRLDLQGELYRDTTERCLRDAGIGPGDRVLDVGSGTGDVSLLCAGIVGPEGEVVGYDREATAVEAARERVRKAGLTNVGFDSEPLATRSGIPFDAVVGRFILMHQADPSQLLREATRLVRPGGVVAFVESSMVWLLQGPHSTPHSALYDRVVRWKHAVVESAGADCASGSHLERTFVKAGLAPPRQRLEAVIAGTGQPEAVRYMVDSVRSMMPQGRTAGVEPTFGDVETLASRLLADMASSGGTITLWPTVSAWVRTA